MISTAISTLLTYMDIFRLNGHDFFISYFVVFLFSFIYFMKKCNNCSSVDLILYTFQLIISAQDKLLGQLGIYATWLSTIAYLQKQLRIIFFKKKTPRFWQ